MNDNKTPPASECQIRCPRLGHQIHFDYCRTENIDGPCFKVLDCWYPYFDVAAFFKETLPNGQWRRLAQGCPAPKMTSLLTLIEKAKSAGASK